MIGTRLCRILVFLLLPNSPVAHYLSCPAITGELNSVEWSSTSDKTLSEPPCVGKNKEFVYRNCTDGEWATEPYCDHIQKETISNCPEGYHEMGNLCYAFSQAASFPPQCPSEDIISFQEYKNVIDFSSPIWVPVKRDYDNGIGYMRWLEPSSNYKTTFEDYIQGNGSKRHDCLVYSNEKSYEAVSCHENHPRICIYNSVELKKNNELCNNPTLNCFQTNIFDKTRCTCVAFEELKEPLVEFHSTEENKISLEETCSFGLEKLANGTYIWSTSRTEINYTFWSTNVTFDKNNIFGALTTEGWILTPSLLQCRLYEIIVEELEPSLELELYDDYFFLQINDAKGLKTIDGNIVFCFTDADPLELISRIKSFLMTGYSKPNSVSLTFDFLSRAPGHYWCEAFRSKDMEIIKSDVILYENSDDYLEFASRFRFSQIECDLIESVLDYVYENYFTTFEDSQFKNTIARIMKIVELDVDKKEIVIIVHFSVLKTENNNKLTIRNWLFSLLKEFFEEGGNVEILDLVSTNSCLAEFDGKLNWPETQLLEEAITEEFCLDENGMTINRKCDGNFIDGAQWSSYHDCEIHEPSNISYILRNFNDDPKIEDLKKIYEITKNQKNFTALDVNLIAEEYRLLSNNVGNHLEYAAKIIDNLLNIDRKVLEESQKKMKATGKILEVWRGNLSKNSLLQITDLTNFAFLSLKARDLKSVVILKNNDFKILTDKIAMKQILKFDGLESAIFLDDDLTEQFTDNTTVEISIFFNDGFFQNNSSKFKNISTIFRITITPPLPNFLSSIKIIYKIHTIFNEEEMCVIWKQTNYSGSWIENEPKNRAEKFMICNYWQAGYFAFGYNPGNATDLTDALITTLHSKKDTPKILENLYHISTNYDQFEPIHLTYVAEIFEILTYRNDIDLENLVKIVSNLHNIKKEILIESQIKDKATDAVLASVDDIILKNQSQVQVEADNFMILIEDVSKLNGIALLSQRKSFSTQILNDYSSIEDVTSYKNFYGALYLHPDLIKQLETSQIVITVFNNDALFSERQQQHKAISKIFGVILPDIGEYSGPVSILNKVRSPNTLKNCVYWEYSEENFGFWKKERDAQDVDLDIVRCDFHHTTHFALLILDKDNFDNDSSMQPLILEIISTINSILSLVCLICIVLTGLVFKQWRSKSGNQILLNFTAVMIMQQTVFQISSKVGQEQKNYLTCTIVGLLLHYSTISQFCWMLVVAFLQYRRFVLVLNASPEKVLLKSCVCGWVLPLIPVSSVFAYDRNNYSFSKVALCYPSGWGLYLGVWFPVFVIIIINTFFFVIILINVTCKKTKLVDCEKSEMLYQWRLGVLLFLLLGLVWVFGFAANFRTEISVISEYVFIMTATLEGVILFVFFILCNSDTRLMYRKAVKKYYVNQFK